MVDAIVEWPCRQGPQVFTASERPGSTTGCVPSISSCSSGDNTLSGRQGQSTPARCLHSLWVAALHTFVKAVAHEGFCTSGHSIGFRNPHPKIPIFRILEVFCKSSESAEHVCAEKHA